MYLRKLGREWDVFNVLLLFCISTFAISKPAIKLVSEGVENISELSTSYSGNLNTLFANNSSIGVLAICAAEGNCTSEGKKTSSYYYNLDPGNQVGIFRSQDSSFNDWLKLVPTRISQQRH